MSDGYYEWWRAIDNDERWQWEQMQRNQQPSGGQTTKDIHVQPKAPSGQEKAA